MNEPDDPLWTGAPEPGSELAALEALLRPLAHSGRPLPELPEGPPPAHRRRFRTATFAAALTAGLAAAALLLAAWLWYGGTVPAPLVLTPGTSAQQFAARDLPLQIELGTLAAIELAPGSTLDFTHWRPDQARFHLRSGSMAVRVAPPPAVAAGFFQVDTNLGRVVDQGCRYELALDAPGNARIRVTEGAVTFEVGNRTLFVPAGASLQVTQGVAQLPRFVDAPPAVRKTCQFLQTMTLKGSERDRALAAQDLADACQTPRDGLVLWHLLDDDQAEVRKVAEGALLRLCGPPAEAPPGKGEALQHWPAAVWLQFLRQQAWR